MSRPLVGSLNGCALHGALVTAAAIEGVATLVHSTPGCALRGAGSQSAPTNLRPIASTNLAEKHIVFGGGARLREEIKNALSILPHGLLVVLTGCPTAMIGDDVAAMVKEAASQGAAVVAVAAAGFLGSGRRGYELLLDVLAARPEPSQPPAAGVGPRLVNLFGIVPRYDEHWVSDLDEIGRILADVGLRANPIVGPSGGVASLHALPRAAASLVLSPWGLGPARTLEARHGVPVVVADGLPVGADAAEDLLRRIAASTGLIDDTALESLIATERRYEDFALDETLNDLARLGRRRVAIVGGSLLARSLARFLTATLGWEAATIVQTDEPPAVGDPSAAGVVSTADFAEAAAAVRASGGDFLVAGQRHRVLAAELAIPLLPISDLGGRAALAGGFTGARGAGRLLAAIAATQNT